MLVNNQLRFYIDTIYAHSTAECWHGVTIIDPKTHEISHQFFKAKDQHKLIDYLDTLHGVNVFARITPLCDRPEKGRGKADASAGTSVLWVDCDNYSSLEALQAQFEALPLPPSFTVHSGKGVHAYWYLSKFETDLQAIKSANIALAEKLNAIDPQTADHCFDLARILRVPTSINYKYSHTPQAYILTHDNSRVYNFDDFPRSTRTIAPVIVGDAQELPAGFLEAIAQKDKKLYYRLKSPALAITKADAETKIDGSLDRSKNDAAVLTRLLSLDYTPEMCISVLQSHQLTTGLRYNGDGRYDYVVTTVNNIYSHWLQSTDRFYNGNKFQPARMVAYLAPETKDKTSPFLYTTETLWRYVNGYYKPDGEAYVKEFVRLKTDNNVTVRQLVEITEGLKDLNRVAFDECNLASGELVNVANGMLDLRTGAVIEHSMSYRNLYQVPAVFDPDVNTSFVDEYLASVLPADTISMFWEFIGSALLANTYWPKAFLVLVGAGDTGKSTLLSFITSVLGYDNVKKFNLHTLAEARFTTSELVGKLANIFSDLDKREVGSVGQIKMLTGNDDMSSERKFKNAFDFANRARLIFSANDYPLVREPDAAFFNRAKIIPTSNVFSPKRANTNLLATLQQPQHLSAALLRMIEGLQRLLQQRQFTVSATMDQAHREYTMRADNVCGFLELCPKVLGAKTRKVELYDAYKQVCKNMNKLPVNQDTFFKRVSDMMQRFNIADVRELRSDGAGKDSYYVNIVVPERAKLVLSF